MILEIVEGPEAGKQLDLTETLDIGRDAPGGLSVDDKQVSRRHLRLHVDNGRVVAEDLNSTNGTYVNDQPILGPRELAPGDRVRAGLTVMQLRTPQQVQAQPSAARPIPQLTAVGQGVLQPVPEEELTPREPAPNVPTFATEESEPAFVPRQLVQNSEDASDEYRRLATLVDSRVKQQTSIASFALIALAALVVVLYFGLIA